jgi:hypothetical protein
MTQPYERTHADAEPDPRHLARLLRELRGIDRLIRGLPTVSLCGVPGRSPENALIAVDDASRARLQVLQRRRGDVLDRIVGAGAPVGRWFEHGPTSLSDLPRSLFSRRLLLYLDPLPEFDQGAGDHELHCLPARARRWVPSDIEEPPAVTKRRAAYARRRSSNLRLLIAACALVAYLCLLTLPPLAALAVLASWLFRPTPPPYEGISPGTGEPSPALARAREMEEARLEARRLDALVPPAPAPMQLTHDYPYRYEGFHPGAEADCRVRIFQAPEGQRPKPKPVVVLSQNLDPLSGTSLTNLIEAIAADVVLANLPHLMPQGRLADLHALKDPPFRVVEHYCGDHPMYHREEGDRDGENFAIVTFSSYRVQAPQGLPEVEEAAFAGEPYIIVRSNATERPRFGEPEWHHRGVGRATVERMLGREL